MPLASPSWMWASPVWSPARISRPERANVVADRAGRSESRARARRRSRRSRRRRCSTSVPRNWARRRRTTAWCCSRSWRNAASPISAARSVEPTMSVNRNVPSMTSGSSAASSAPEERLGLVQQDLVRVRIGPRIAVDQARDLAPHRARDVAGREVGGSGGHRAMGDERRDADGRQHVGDVALHDHALERGRGARAGARAHVPDVPAAEVGVVGDGRAVLAELAFEELGRAP